MSVGVLLVTHPGLGPDLLQTARRVMPMVPLQVAALEVPWETTDSVEQLAAMRQRVAALDRGDGVLVLVDLYGSTPANLARSTDPGGQVRRVYGLNLPMLLRVLNYPQQNLDALAQVALEGGRAGVIKDDG